MILEELLAKTRADRVKWEATAQPGAYFASVGGEFTFELRDETIRRDLGVGRLFRCRS